MEEISFKALPDEALIRLSKLLKTGVVPLSKSTLLRRCKAEQFPAPIKLSSSSETNTAVAWRVGEIRVWLANPSEYKSPRPYKRKEK